LDEEKNMALISPDSIQFINCDTPQKVFFARCHEWANKPALRHKRRGLWQTISWVDYFDNARAMGLAFSDMGLRHGDVVCVLAENRPEWLYADMGAQCMGLVGNGIYPTASPEQVAFILQHSRTRVLLVENQEQLEKALSVRSTCPDLQRIVVMEHNGLRALNDEQVTFFDDLLARGKVLAATQAAVFAQSIEMGAPGDIAFLVYTSGTTGQPKGAMVSNRNLVFQLGQAQSYLDADVGDRSLSFLPLCHIAERMATSFNPLAVGLVVHFPENAGTVFNDLREVAPHVLFAPPRFWEKMYSQVDLLMRDAVSPARWVYSRALTESKTLIEAKLAGTYLETSALKRLQNHLHNFFAFRNLKIFLGLQNVKTALTGAAPVPADLIKWFLSIGIELREAFGMTETSGFCTATPAGRIKLGSAGKAGDGTDLKIGLESEIMVRGPNVFVGYWRDADKTREAIDTEGWLHTGDCGELDGDGYLAITGRIKDIMITSGGKNISPSQIENLLKFSPYITDAVAVGDGRHFVSALIMIDLEHVARFAQEKQVPYTDFASLTRSPEVIALIDRQVTAANAQLARVEQVKEFRIISELLGAEDEELTPTMKLKRKVVATKYAELINGMYAQSQG
jgi:long-chain acyl-CoA synthetase